MKMTLALLFIISSPLWATTYKFVNQNVATFETNTTYQLTPEFSLKINHVKELGSKKAKATVTVNGNTADYDLRIKSVVRSGTEKIKTFEGTLKRDVLADMACSEYEAVNYNLTFTEISEYSHYSYIKNVELTAKKLYSYDWCHSHTEITAYKYLKL